MILVENLATLEEKKDRVLSLHTRFHQKMSFYTFISFFIEKLSLACFNWDFYMDS